MKLVLFLNMGGASNLRDCEIFLKNMFNDPYILGIQNKFIRKFVAWIITKFRVKSMKDNYKKIGGKSPLNELTQSLCDKLNLKQNAFKFDFVNLYVSPFADEVLQKYSLNEKDEIILFPLYPHHSCTTVTSSIEVLQNEILRQKIPAKVKIIDIFYKDKNYNEVLLAHILKKQQEFGAKILLFSAHSLPQKIIAKGDLYEQHIQEHVKILKEKLGNHFDQFILAYQSKLGPVKWLEPNTSDILANLEDKVLIYPISFCIDCSETIFELNIEYRHLAKCEYEVIACPNDSEEFANFILDYLKSI